MNVNKLLKNKNILFLISIVCIFLMSTIMGLSDWDFVWQSRLGKYIVTEHDFNGLRHLVWGTQGIDVYYDHEWLTNVFFYIATVLFGETGGIIAIKLLIELSLGIVTYMFVTQFFKSVDDIDVSAFFSIVVVTYLFVNSLVKPKAYDISLIFFMLLLILLDKRCKDTISFRKFSLYIALLVVLWNNFHSGSIILIFGVTGLFWLLYWRDLKTVILGIICLLLLLVNPFGYKLIYFDLTHAFDNVMKKVILDWRGLDLSMMAGKAICIMLIVMFIHLLNMKITKNNVAYVILFAGFCIMTISSMRHFLYLYPIGIYIIIQGQYKDVKFIKMLSYSTITYLISVFTLVLLVMFGVNFHNIETEYAKDYITPTLETLLDKTLKDNDGLFTDDINIWSSGYKSFQSGAFPYNRDRVLDSYTLITGSDTQISTLIDYYGLNKFLFYKTHVDDRTTYLLNSNLYDYMMSRPNDYVLLYDDDVLVYFVTTEVYDEIK